MGECLRDFRGKHPTLKPPHLLRALELTPRFMGNSSVLLLLFVLHDDVQPGPTSRRCGDRHGLVRLDVLNDPAVIVPLRVPIRLQSLLDVDVAVQELYPRNPPSLPRLTQTLPMELVVEDLRTPCLMPLDLDKGLVPPLQVHKLLLTMLGEAFLRHEPLAYGVARGRHPPQSS